MDELSDEEKNELKNKLIHRLLEERFKSYKSFYKVDDTHFEYDNDPNRKFYVHVIHIVNGVNKGRYLTKRNDKLK